MTTTPTERRLAITPDPMNNPKDMLVSGPKTWKVEPDGDKFIAVSTDGNSVFGRAFATEEDAQTVANCMHNITKLRSERDELVGALRAVDGHLRDTFPPYAPGESPFDKVRDVLSKHKPE